MASRILSLENSTDKPARFTNVWSYERLSIVSLQLKDLPGTLIKGRFTNVRGYEGLCLVPLPLQMCGVINDCLWCLCK